MPDCMACIRFAKGTGGRIKPMYKVSEGVRSTHGQDGAVVLDVRQGKMFNLNFVGSRILEFLKNGHSVPEIVENISHEFNIGRDLAEADVRDFLQTLEEQRLIERDSSGFAA